MIHIAAINTQKSPCGYTNYWYRLLICKRIELCHENGCTTIYFWSIV